MGASAKTPTWKFYLQKLAPFLFRRCLGYNMHWRWERVCYCVIGENGHGIMLRTFRNRWLDTKTPFDYEA